MIPNKTGAPYIQSPKKNIILDATVLSTLMSCPRLADFRFNHNLVSIKGKSNSLEVGSIVHKVLEVAYKLMINGVKRDDAVGHGLIAGELYAQGCPHCASFVSGKECDICIHGRVKIEDDLVEAFVDCRKCGGVGIINKPQCGHQIDEYPGVINTPVESDAHYVGWKYALDTAQQYFEFYKNDSWVSLEVETVKGEILYEDDEIRVLWKAKLDWIVDNNQGIYPVDHKTQKQKRAKIKLNNQFMGQCLVMKTRNMIVNNIGFQKTLKPIEKFTREMMSYSSAILTEWQSEILPYWAYKLLDYTEGNYYPPNFTHCENKFGNCPMIGVCGSDPNMRQEELRLNFVKGQEWNPTNEIES